MEHLFQLWFQYIILVWLFFWLIGLQGGKIALLPLQRHVSTWTKISLSFWILFQVPSSPGLCSFRKWAPGQRWDSWRSTPGTNTKNGSSQRGSKGLWLALGSWELFPARCCTRPRQCSHLYIQESGRFCLGELHFLKSKQLREAERRIWNIRLK